MYLVKVQGFYVGKQVASDKYGMEKAGKDILTQSILFATQFHLSIAEWIAKSIGGEVLEVQDEE